MAGYIGAEKALQKIKYYCSYQERSHTEVRQKLYSFGLVKEQVEEFLSELISTDYLNEERFAVAFAGGRFRLKQWGRVKIENELKQKKVSAYSIKKALAAIPEADYQQTFEKLLAAKSKQLSSEKNIFTKRTKIKNYLMQKGYEYKIILEAFKTD